MQMINLHWSVENQSQSQTLEVKQEIIIGRNLDCTISIPHQTVSRQHAALIPRSDGIYLQNLSETNPISVSGGVILSAGDEKKLTNNDVFVLGRVNVSFTVADLPKVSFKVKCTGCGKVVETTMTDCPWCGTSLAFGETFIGS
jgi:pSer/pThr/pTyr-binding forkhead associated (FHA) protein